VRRRLFWPFIALGSLLLALAAASFTVAVFSDPIPRGSVTYSSSAHYYWETEAFGRMTSLSWSSDRGFLIAAAIFVAAGLGTYIVAAKSR
jgi:hypothetical protein